MAYQQQHSALMCVQVDVGTYADGAAFICTTQWYPVWSVLVLVTSNLQAKQLPWWYAACLLRCLPGSRLHVGAVTSRVCILACMHAYAKRSMCFRACNFTAGTHAAAVMAMCLCLTCPPAPLSRTWPSQPNLLGIDSPWFAFRFFLLLLARAITVITGAPLLPWLLPTLVPGTDQRFKRLRVDGVNVGVSVWDTAGQDRFQSLTPMYYRGAQGVVYGE